MAAGRHQKWCTFITIPRRSHMVISCFARCLDKLRTFLLGLFWTAWISALRYVYNILQDTNGVSLLYALFLAPWCWCLYIYTVQQVNCAILLHVWNKLEWAWQRWKWACCIYFYNCCQSFKKKHRRNSTPSQSNITLHIYKVLKLQREISSSTLTLWWECSHTL